MILLISSSFQLLTLMFLRLCSKSLCFIYSITVSKNIFILPPSHDLNEMFQ